MMTAGTFPMPVIAHCDINDALQVGYSFGPYAKDIYNNTTGGAQDSGRLTFVTVGSSVTDALFNPTIPSATTTTGTISASGVFTPGTSTGTFSMGNTIIVNGALIGNLDAGLSLAVGGYYSGPVVTSGTLIQGYDGWIIRTPKTTTYVKWADGSSSQVTGSETNNYINDTIAGLKTTDVVSGKSFPITLYTADYAANQVDRNCELSKQINTRQYRVQPYGLNLLTNGNFASGTGTGWTTVSGTVTIGAGASSAPTSYTFDNSANKYLSVNGGSTDVVLTQSLTTVVGNSYRVEGAGYGLTGGAGNPYDSRVKVEIGASTLYNNYVSLDYYPAFYGPYVFKATSTTTVFKLTVHAVGQSIKVGHFSVRQLLPTRVAKLTAGVSTQTNQVDLTATDVNGNEYWVTKLQAHLCTVVPKNPSSGNLVYTSGKRAPWRESPASGIYLDLNTTFSY
jgi:hypothetical protein